MQEKREEDPLELGNIREVLETGTQMLPCDERKEVDQRLQTGDLLPDVLVEEEGGWGDALEEPDEGFQSKEDWKNPSHQWNGSTFTKKNFGLGVGPAVGTQKKKKHRNP